MIKLAYFLHVERILNEIIPANTNVKFDSILKQSKTKQENDAAENDFIFSDDGSEIGIKRVGTYTIQWYLSQMTGLSTTGQVFRLQTKDEAGNWDYLGDGSSHLKVSASSGFGVLDVTEELLEEARDQVVWVRLQNAGNAAATLGNRHRIKGALVIYSLGDRGFQADGIQAGISWDISDDNWKPITVGQEIAPGALIPFDILLSDSYFGGIELMSPGLFKITAPGKYKIDWELPINTVDYAGRGLIGLYINDQLYSYSHLPMVRGIVNGTAIIDVWFDETIDIHLTNLSGCTIRAARYSSLTITHLCPPTSQRPKG